MDSNNNTVSFEFNSYEGCEFKVRLIGQNVNDVELAKLLTKFLTTVGSRITLNL